MVFFEMTESLLVFWYMADKHDPIDEEVSGKNLIVQAGVVLGSSSADDGSRLYFQQLYFDADRSLS